MSYEYVTKTKKDPDESIRVLSTLEKKEFKVVAVRWKPETNSIVIYFEKPLTEEEKEKLDKVMRNLGYMVL